MTTRRPPRPPSDTAGRRGARSDQGGRSGRQGGRDAPRGDAPRGDGSRGDSPRGERPQGARPQSGRPQVGHPQGARQRGDLQFGERRGGTGQRSDHSGGYAQRSERAGANPARADRSSDEKVAGRGQRRERTGGDFFADERPRGERRFGDRHRDARRTDVPRSAASRDEGLRFARPQNDATRAERPTKAAPRKVPKRAVVAPLEPEDANDFAYHDEPQRIAKLLARAGVGSRRDVERMIEEGRVTLNGELLQQPAPLLQSLDGLAVDGVAVARPVSTRLFRFYKPNGCLTAARDPKGRKTIYDVLPDGLPRLMPVGRLDYNTEGLLLMTNDGEFKRELELPATGVERTYRARAFGEISQSQLEELALGVEIEGVRYGKIDANLERRTGANQWIEMTLTEGKNREVRNVLEYLGLQVNRLIRVRYGDFTIDGMEPGDVDVVPRDIVNQFRRQLR